MKTNAKPVVPMTQTVNINLNEVDEHDLPHIENVIRCLRKQKRANLNDLYYAGMTLLAIAQRNGLHIP
jgi:hypothetical protein